MKRWRWLALLFITGLALAFRLPELDRRPMHNDEAANAIKLRDLWQDGRFVYDPIEYHGPTLFYASLPLVWLSSAPDFEHLTETQMRRVAVAFGIALVLLVALLADALGWPAMLAAAALTAVSPAMVFYSRYFIHEMLLVVFSALLIGAGWRWWQTGRPIWAALAGAALGLMFATKETFVLAVAAMWLASVTVFFWRRMTGTPTANKSGVAWQTRLHWRSFATFAFSAALVWLVLFSSFFTNAAGLLDSIKTYSVYFNRAGTPSPHIHAWSFYLERLAWFHQPKGHIWSEGAILLLAMLGAGAALLGRGIASAATWPARWLVIYTGALTALYCIIGYKTPWCLLGFFHGWILLAGVGVGTMWHWSRMIPGRVGVSIVLLAAATHLSWQSWRASFVEFASRQNPYVYAQTLPNALDLVHRIEGIAAIHADGHDMLVKVVAAKHDYWPLPYYLRAFHHVGWWDAVPADPGAAVVVVSTSLHAALDEHPDRPLLMSGLYELRPGTFLELYVEPGLWAKYVTTLPPPAD